MPRILAPVISAVLILAAPAANGGQDVGQLGQPSPGLSAAELAAFNEGKRLFVEKLPSVGPLYNDQSCAGCHSIPTLGGSGDPAHGAFLGPGQAEVPHKDGRPKGDVEGYRRYALSGWTAPTRPANVSLRIPPPLYGLGLIEQIPDETIRAHCGTGHVDIAKQQGSLPHNEVARFGIKPFLGTVPDFVGAALNMESSVTNPVEGGTDPDEFPDPEVDAKFVEALAAYVRGLQAPTRDGTDAAGEAAFQSLGCATCHVQNMPPANGVYSDLCLHHMGEALADGIFDHEAEGDEFRTTPLWGLRFRKLYLHDGRATTLDAAITAHGGEAQSAADAYRNAPAQQRAALLRFLDTL
jgi:CxxC motif-containing protein (DUF1111 family)